jgi:hypothetical protein
MKKILLLLLVAVAPLWSLRAEPIVALTSGDRLLTFDSATPETVSKAVTVSGLDAGDTLVGIDFRPFSGELFGLGSSGRLYRIDTESGAATAVGNAIGAVELNGTQFGFDFNPVVDRIRVTSDADQNFRINPLTGATTVDEALHYAAEDPNVGADPNVTASAYTNNSAGATTTSLYDIDTHLEILVRQDPPNSGTLNTVGPLGLDVDDNASLDVSPLSGIAYAYLHPTPPPPPADGVNGVPPPLVVPGLFTIDLTTGQATPVGRIGDDTSLAGETVVAIAVPAASNKLLNLSTRGRVDNGENVLIAGFIERGSSDSKVLLRGIGPSLTGVSEKLTDPVLTLFDKNGTVLQTNDDWQDSADATGIQATGLAPTDAAEAAIIANLPPGEYTAHVTSGDGTAGVALVEIYPLP